MKKTSTTLILAAAIVMTGCVANNPLTKHDTPEPTAAAAPAQSGATKTQNTKTAAVAPAEGDRKEVKGLGDWNGYMLGKPAPRTKFTKLQIGMSQKEALDIAGYPTDRKADSTAKSWVPVIILSGAHQTVYYYKGMGRLVFANGTNSVSNYYLVGIEHDALERGYKQ